MGPSLARLAVFVTELYLINKLMWNGTALVEEGEAKSWTWITYTFVFGGGVYGQEHSNKF